MGNASSVGEGGEKGEIGGDVGQDLMGQSPPQTPRRAAQSPLLFTPQNPMVPLRRPDEMFIPGNTLMQNTRQCDEVMYEEGIPTMITWSYGGKEVAVEGSWDNWNSKKILQKSGKDFAIMEVLPSGVYQYRFSVDGECRYSPDMPWGRDQFGNAYNILDLQKEFGTANRREFGTASRRLLKIQQLIYGFPVNHYSRGDSLHKLCTVGC